MIELGENYTIIFVFSSAIEEFQISIYSYSITNHKVKLNAFEAGYKSLDEVFNTYDLEDKKVIVAFQGKGVGSQFFNSHAELYPFESNASILLEVTDLNTKSLFFYSQKNQIEQLLQLLKTQKAELIDFYLSAPAILIKYADQLQLEFDSFVFFNQLWKFDSNSIEVEKTNESRIPSEQLTEKICTAIALEAYVNNDNAKQFGIDILDENRTKIQKSNQLKKKLLPIVLTLFVILAANYFLRQFFVSEYLAFETTATSLNIKKEQLKQQKKELAAKKDFIREIGLSQQQSYAQTIDEISAIASGSLHLNSFIINNPKANSKKGYVFEQQSIWLKGECQSIKEIEAFIASTSKLSWVEKIKIEAFGGKGEAENYQLFELVIFIQQPNV